MKKITSLMMMMLSLLVASCSDNDDVENVAANVAGEYAGYTVAECNYFKNSVSADQSVTITAQSVDKVSISYESDTWGTFTIENATVAGSKGEYTINGTGKSLMGHAGATAKEYDCSVTATVRNGVVNMMFTCPSVMGGLKISFVQGDVPAELILPGDYAGYTVASATYFNGTVTENETVTITNNGDGKYSISYESDTWGSITIDNVSVEYSNGKFLLSGEGVSKMGMNGNVKEYACEFTGSVDVEKKAPGFTFTCPTVMGGLTIQFYYGEYNG